MEQHSQKERTIADLWPGDTVLARAPGRLGGHPCRVIDVIGHHQSAGAYFVHLKLRDEDNVQFTLLCRSWHQQV